MQPEPNNIQDKFSKASLDNNKNEMFKILKEAPIAGIYQGQDPNHWINFFNFYLNFLKSQIGPRGQCTKSVRIAMQKNPEFYDQILSLIKMTHKSHIRDIYVKYKMFSPCKQYDDLLKLRENLAKNEESYDRIMDQNSIMYNQIKAGMIKKRGEQYDYKEEISKIRQAYKQKIQILRKMKNQLQEKVENNQNYRKYVKLKEGMKQFFVMWKQADTRVGNESVQKGNTFEKIVQNNLLPILLQRSNISHDTKIKIESNCRWYPKTLGQIDIAILTYSQIENKWVAQVLIECKSRLFDIREAYSQVAILKAKGKQKLCTSTGIIDIANNPQFFIVTTLPQNPFHLPIQSKLKQGLQKAGKNIPIQQLKQQQLFPILSENFKELKSPLQWFLQNDSDNIIVLKY